MNNERYYTEKRAVYENRKDSIQHLVCLCTNKKYALDITRALNVMKDGKQIPNVMKDGKQIPNEISIWYMHDNHTFTKLTGNMKEVMKKAEELKEKSSYGTLCPPILMYRKKEVRRVGISLHARRKGEPWAGGKTIGDWRDAVYKDVDAVRLMVERKCVNI